MPRSALHAVARAHGDSPAAVLIASKDGAGTIAATVRSAVYQADVYVVSDGSSDDTAAVARAAGATVLHLETNVGKPAAIYKAAYEFGLLDRYAHISILDDDTVIAPDFVEECLSMFADDPRNAIVVGKTITNWTDEQRWNPWVAARAYSYWRYQVTIRPGQDVFNALNCISGSNSMYTAELLREVLVEQTPYIVDDTYWVLETHRRKLGRVRYAPDAEAYIQDPTNQREWYKQNLRWLWGTVQGIIGHRVGRRGSWFDLWYMSLIADWVLYVVAWPAFLLWLVMSGTVSPLLLVLGISGGYLIWTTAAAASLGRWHLVLFTPFIIYFDWLYRVNFVHATIKAFRQPTVESCRWDSPVRYEQSAHHAQPAEQTSTAA
jgi:poly-beta-1,6-N-acetyl-D-glucosamine synthase